MSMNYKLHWFRGKRGLGKRDERKLVDGASRRMMWRYKRAPLVGASPASFNSPCSFIPSVIFHPHFMFLPRALSVSGFTPFVIRREEIRRPLELGRSTTQRNSQESCRHLKTSPEVESRGRVQKSSPVVSSFVRRFILLCPNKPQPYQRCVPSIIFVQCQCWSAYSALYVTFTP